MRYLVACDDFFPDRPAGAARVAWDMALAMRDRGHAVCHVCLNQRPGELPDGRAEVEGTTVVRYTPPVYHAMDPRRFRGRLRAAAAEVRQALGGEPRWDVLHIHSPLTGRAVADAVPDVKRRIYTAHSPVVLEQQINWGQQGWRGRVKALLGTGVLRRLEGALMHACDRVHVLSDYNRRELDRFHALGSRLITIPHWQRLGYARTVDRSAARRALGWPDDRPILFTLRRHVHRMGLDVSIDAVAPLAKAGRCRFMVGGDGPLRPTLQSQAAAAGCDEDAIRFLGYMNDADLPMAYQAADLFLLPTRALECFGLIAQEAMACGCPVLGTDVGAIPELLRPVTPQLIVPPDNSSAMQALIEQFLAGGLDVPAASELAADTAQRYGRDRILPRVLELLEGDGGNVIGLQPPAGVAQAAAVEAPAYYREA